MADDRTVAVAGRRVVPSLPAAVPGELLLAPASLLAVAVLVVNDHWLKPRLGADPRLGTVTGKLSDIAGLAFFPLVVVSLLELGRSLWCRSRSWSRSWSTTRRELAGTVAAVGVGFAAIKVVPAAAGVYTGSLAVLRWLPGGLGAMLTAAPSPPLPRIHHVMDVSDCLSLPALWCAHRTGMRGIGRRGTA